MNTTRHLTLAAMGLCALTLVGCETSKSRNPLSPTVAGPIAGVTITAPKPLEPSNNTNLTSTSPITLLIENAASSGERPLWLQVEIATDSSFSSKAHVGDKIAPGDGGRTSYVVPVSLAAAGTRYFWRSRALDGANTGEYSPVSSFVLNDPVQIAVPASTYPQNGATVDTVTPDLAVVNGAATGPLAGPVLYRFEIASDPGFGAVVAILTVARSGAATTNVRPTPLAYASTYYWRVNATDGVLTTPYSPTFSFRTPAAPAPPGCGTRRSASTAS